jgi:hypothetical protein
MQYSTESTTEGKNYRMRKFLISTVVAGSTASMLFLGISSTTIGARACPASNQGSSDVTVSAGPATVYQGSGNTGPSGPIPSGWVGIGSSLGYIEANSGGTGSGSTFQQTDASAGNGYVVVAGNNPATGGSGGVAATGPNGGNSASGPVAPGPC